MSRRGTEIRRLPGQVLVRLTHEQQSVVASLAHARQISSSAWVRGLIADAIGVDRGPVMVRSHPPEIILQLAALRQVLARLVEAIEQLAIVAPRPRQQAEWQQIEQLILLTKEAVHDVDSLKERLWRPAA